MKSYLIFLSVVAAVVAVSATDYCSKELCRPGVKHIACGHSGKFDRSCPRDANMVPMSDKLKDVLIQAHNAKRNFIAGGGDPNHSPACRMATMEWDDELAANAALNAKQCKMAHDKCRNTAAFKYAGQNLGWISVNGNFDHSDTLKEIVEMWYSEVQYSNQYYIDSYPSSYSGPAIGHYTVMMADRNKRFGCAAVTYTGDNNWYKTYLLVCDYSTTNMINSPIYAKCNTAGENCKTGRNHRYPNLCSSSEPYDVNKWF